MVCCQRGRYDESEDMKKGANREGPESELPDAP